jgi:hypothetical protein
MRTANYRDDVLWAIAYKLGLDPAKEFLTDEAESLASYINAWVRRNWDGTDFPEWTSVKEFSPDPSHQVPYQAIPVGATESVTLSRPLKVYLVDPRATPYPIDTRFRAWDEGLHVGFDHGASVWIKYLGLPPKFTSIPWDSAVTYNRGDLAYSPLSGECYISNSSGNLGHDPTGQQGAHPPPLTVAVLQPAEPETPAIAGRPQITKVTLVVDPILTTSLTQHNWDILDSTGAVIASATYAGLVSEPPADILTAIFNSLDANAALSAFTFTLDTTALAIQIEASQFFAVRSYYYSYTSPADESVTTGMAPTPGELVTGDDLATVTIGAPYPWPPAFTVNNTINNLQYYMPAVTYVPAKAQIIELTMSPQSAVAGASYELTFSDTVGPPHTIDYLNDPARSSAGILLGIVEEIQASTDPFFSAMSLILDAPLLKLTFAAYDMVSLNAEVVPRESTWWELVPFPLALVEPVVRGAYSDALREAGQTDKAMAEEQGAGAEVADRVTKALAPGYTDLTDQRAPAPRYRGKLQGQNLAGAGK